MNSLTQSIQPDGLKRTWHVTERFDGSITVYYTRTGTDAHFVVYDTLDNDPSRVAESEELQAALRAVRDAFEKREIALTKKYQPNNPTYTKLSSESVHIKSTPK